MIVVSFSKQTTDTLGNYCLIWIRNKSLKSHRIVAKYFNKLKEVVDDRSRIKPKVRPNYSAELFGRMYIRFLPNIRPNNLSKNCYICQQIFNKLKDFFGKKSFQKYFQMKKSLS